MQKSSFASEHQLHQDELARAVAFLEEHPESALGYFLCGKANFALRLYKDSADYLMAFMELMEVTSTTSTLNEDFLGDGPLSDDNASLLAVQHEALQLLSACRKALRLRTWRNKQSQQRNADAIPATTAAAVRVPSSSEKKENVLFAEVEGTQTYRPSPALLSYITNHEARMNNDVSASSSLSSDEAAAPSPRFPPSNQAYAYHLQEAPRGMGVLPVVEDNRDRKQPVVEVQNGARAVALATFSASLHIALVVCGVVFSLLTKCCARLVSFLPRDRENSGKQRGSLLTTPLLVPFWLVMVGIVAVSSSFILLLSHHSCTWWWVWLGLQGDETEDGGSALQSGFSAAGTSSSRLLVVDQASRVFRCFWTLFSDKGSPLSDSPSSGW